MAILQLIIGDLPAREFSGVRMSVGRDAANDVVLLDPSVSSFHAEFHSEEGRLYLVDLASSNGTFVNGNRLVGRVGLVAWDKIRFGSVEGEILDPQGRSRTRVQAAVNFSNDRPTVERDGMDMALEGSTASLVGLSSTIRGVRHLLTRKSVLIGRDDQNVIVLPDSAVSAHHAKILHWDDAWMIQDLQSTNGTFLNGSAVIGSQRLWPGALIRLGRLEFRFEDSAAPPWQENSTPGYAPSPPIPPRNSALPWVLGIGVAALVIAAFFLGNSMRATPSAVTSSQTPALTQTTPPAPPIASPPNTPSRAEATQATGSYQSQAPTFNTASSPEPRSVPAPINTPSRAPEIGGVRAWNDTAGNTGQWTAVSLYELRDARDGLAAAREVAAYFDDRRARGRGDINLVEAKVLRDCLIVTVDTGNENTVPSEIDMADATYLADLTHTIPYRNWLDGVFGKMDAQDPYPPLLRQLCSTGADRSRPRERRRSRSSDTQVRAAPREMPTVNLPQSATATLTAAPVRQLQIVGAKAKWEDNSSAAEAVDGDVSTGYHSGGSHDFGRDRNMWIEADLGAAHQITEVQIFWTEVPSYKNARIAMSEDGSSFADFASVSLNTNGDWTVVPGVGRGRYVRIFYAGSGVGGHGMDVQEIRVLGR